MSNIEKGRYSEEPIIEVQDQSDFEMSNGKFIQKEEYVERIIIMTDVRLLQVINQKEVIHNVLLTDLLKVEFIKDSPDLLLILKNKK